MTIPKFSSTWSSKIELRATNKRHEIFSLTRQRNSTNTLVNIPGTTLLLVRRSIEERQIPDLVSWEPLEVQKVLQRWEKEEGERTHNNRRTGRHREIGLKVGRRSRELNSEVRRTGLRTGTEDVNDHRDVSRPDPSSSYRRVNTNTMDRKVDVSGLPSRVDRMWGPCTPSHIGWEGRPVWRP